MNDFNDVFIINPKLKGVDLSKARVVFAEDVCGSCPSTGYQRCATSADCCDGCDCAPCCKGTAPENTIGHDGQKPELPNE
ncbi:hypothetical protein KKD52_10195 [Myxococcota bacterium]|nr:hypothetical protein [Myxococcota bacterium]